MWNILGCCIGSSGSPLHPPLINADNISQQIKSLDINMATQESDIPTKLVKRFDNLIVDYLQENFNNCLKKGIFPKDFNPLVPDVH